MSQPERYPPVEATPRPSPLVSDRVGGIFLGLCSVFWFVPGLGTAIAAIVFGWGTTIDCNNDGLCVMAKGLFGVGAVVFVVLTLCLFAAGAVTIVVAIRFARSMLVNRWIVVVPARFVLGLCVVAVPYFIVEGGNSTGPSIGMTVALGLLLIPVACTNLRPAIRDLRPTAGQPATPAWIAAPTPTRSSSDPGWPTS